MLQANVDGDLKKFIIELRNVCRSKFGYTVFKDFLVLVACAISNAVDKNHYKEREELYLNTVKNYERQEVEEMAALFAKLTLLMQKCSEAGFLDDVLGTVYTQGKFYSAQLGQFFTPYHIATFMAKVNTLDLKNNAAYQKYGLLNVSEPTCGSGVMVLQLCQALKDNGINYQNSVYVEAWDLDMVCALMAYIQFSLYGIPAIVVHGNSITQECYSEWYTPGSFNKDFISKLKIREKLEVLKEIFDKTQEKRKSKILMPSIDEKPILNYESISLF